MAVGQHLGPGGHILAHLDDVLPDGHGAQHLDLIGEAFRLAADALGVFHLHHGIGRVGDHAAGVDEGRLAQAQTHAGRPPHANLAHDAQEGRQRFARAVGVGGAHGVAVHGAAPKGGQRVGRDGRSGSHAPQRPGRGHALALSQRPDVGQQQGAGLVGRQDVEKLGHGGRLTPPGSWPAAPPRQ